MSGLKWLVVVVSCAGLWLSASATGFFYAVDRSVGNTEFVSRWLTRQNLTTITDSVQKIHTEKAPSSEASWLFGFGMSLIEPEIKRQAKAMLDPFYAFLKGKNNELRLPIDLNQWKQAPGLLESAVKIAQENEAMRYLPPAMIESAVKMLIEKIPNEIDFIKLLQLNSDQIAPLRKRIEKFYDYYHIALGLGLFFIALIAFILRDRRQIAFALGFTLLIAGLLLFIPYLGSETLATKMFSRYKGVAPEVVKTLSISLIRDFFVVYVLSPVLLSVAGLVGIVAGMFVFKKQT